MQCILPNARLMLPNSGRSLGGTLYMAGDTFIFKGTTFLGFPIWQYAILWPDEHVVSINPEVVFFGANGVYVFDPLHCTLNLAAREYVKDFLDATPA